MSSNAQGTQLDISSKIRELKDMGFTEDNAKSALARFNNNSEQALNYLLTKNEDNDPELAKAVAASLKDPTPDEISMIHDIEMSKAIENSIKDAGLEVGSFEPLNPESLKKKPGFPVGLKNIGNTCYFNSLIQTYFMIPSLFEEIMTFTCHPSHLETAPSPELERKKACIRLVEELQTLFGYLTISSRKYIDPSKVLTSLVDDFGQQIRVGDQKDVGEFHLILAERIEEGLITKQPLGAEPKEASPVKRFDSANLTGHRLREHSLISKLFYGKQKEFLTVKCSQKVLANEVVFGQIILDVEEKDLYSAWDASYFCEIEDYFVEEIGTTPASQEIWPETFPEVLLFQIQRVKYDRQVNNTVKINSRFTFPLEIFTDRFLKDNREESSGIRSEMLSLKSQKRHIENEIEKFMNYNGSGIGLEVVIENTLMFLEKQTANEAMEVDGVSDPGMLLIEGLDTYSTTIVLKEIKERVSRKVRVLNEQLEDLQRRIEKLYELPNLQLHGYQLHSLLVHDGYAGSGHYYTFVHDIENQSWRKYSDLAINDVTFEEVHRDSVGGHGLANAYCLFYIKKSLLNKKSSPFWTFGMENLESTYYYSLIPEKVLKQIVNDNKKLEEDIQTYQATKDYSKISNLYESRIAELDLIHKENNNNGENIRFSLISFAYYLRLSYNSIFHKYVLRKSYEDATGLKFSDLKWADPVYSKLNTAYQNKMDFSSDLEEKIQKYSKEFLEIVSTAEVVCVLIKMLTEDLLVDSFKLLVFHYELNTFEKDDIFNKLKEYTNAFALRCSSEIYRKVYSNDLEGAVVFASIVGHIMVHFMDQGDVIEKILMQRLEFMLKEFKNKGEQLKLLTDSLTSFIGSIKERELIAQVDLAEMPEVCNQIRIKKEELNPFNWTVGCRNEDIAVRFVKSKNLLNESGFKNWVKLQEDLKRTRNFSDISFKEVEKKTIAMSRN